MPKTSFSADKSPNSLLKVRIQGMHGIACTHTDFMHCIVMKPSIDVCKKQRKKVRKHKDGHYPSWCIKKKFWSLHIEVCINIEGLSIKIVFIAILHAKVKRTLLGNNFLCKARIVLDVTNQIMYFIRNPKTNVKYWRRSTF